MENYRIGFFVDGYTLKKVNEYYRYYHPYKSRIDFKGLKNWAKFEALQAGLRQGQAPGPAYPERVQAQDERVLGVPLLPPLPGSEKEGVAFARNLAL